MAHDIAPRLTAAAQVATNERAVANCRLAARDDTLVALNYFAVD